MSYGHYRPVFNYTPTIHYLQPSITDKEDKEAEEDQDMVNKLADALYQRLLVQDSRHDPPNDPPNNFQPDSPNNPPNQPVYNERNQPPEHN